MQQKTFFWQMNRFWPSFNPLLAYFASANSQTPVSWLSAFQWMRARWTSDPCYAFYGVDGSDCSFLIYLSEVEWFCPPLTWRNQTATPTLKPPPKKQVTCGIWSQLISHSLQRVWVGSRLKCKAASLILTLAQHERSWCEFSSFKCLLAEKK